MVNIPAAQVEAVENGYVAQRHTAIVGKVDRPSPIVNSKITEINFHPFWTVPASIIRKDLIPIMQKKPNYLTDYRIRIYDKAGNELQPQQVDWNTDEATKYMFRQDPSDENSLGIVKINFPSPDGVYMHDTPHKGLFNDEFRFDSSGCVRVQGIRELIVWLLQDTPGQSREMIDEEFRNGERLDVQVAKPVPLLLDLHHGLGDERRRRPFPQRHLRVGRSRPVRPERSPALVRPGRRRTPSPTASFLPRSCPTRIGRSLRCRGLPVGVIRGRCHRLRSPDAIVPRQFLAGPDPYVKPVAERGRRREMHARRFPPSSMTGVD